MNKIRSECLLESAPSVCAEMLFRIMFLQELLPLEDRQDSRVDYLVDVPLFIGTAPAPGCRFWKSKKTGP